MTTDRELDEILAEIGHEHRAMGAPQRLEATLRAVVASRKDAISVRNRKATWAWAVMAIWLAAIATGGGIWQIRKGERLQNNQVRPVSAAQPKAEPPLPSARSAPHENAAAASVPVQRRAADRARLREVSAGQATGNSLDEFVPLPVSEGLPPASELSVVRIKLRGSDLQEYGLQAPADAAGQTMLAEFVVGEDGLPRAIRIVR